MCTGVIFTRPSPRMRLLLHASLAFTSVHFKFAKIMPVSQATVDSLEEKYVAYFVWEIPLVLNMLK